MGKYVLILHFFVFRTALGRHPAARDSIDVILEKGSAQTLFRMNWAPQKGVFMPLTPQALSAEDGSRF